MIYLVGEVETLTWEVKLLNYLGVVMSTNVEVTWHFVYEDETTEFAAFLIP